MSSPDFDTITAFRRHVDTLATQLLAADDPYDIAVQLWGDSGRATWVGALAGGLCAVWGALTDWAERKPAEAGLAAAEMKSAAQGWLALDPQDQRAVTAYFQHWLHRLYPADE
ncbi:hypothetical protein [Micromonospora sp. KC721]|uniref:hypothetical protein n=1 Tax=Micromonospora sp. KC721 TaxID=2530380 RepID=UPI001042CCD6|nr:hypothetical protein [Micromonospora sp. KC721]TDB73336.1 hypothetical protein E1182_21385 [Micromonospora sp. KC721]